MKDTLSPSYRDIEAEAMRLGFVAFGMVAAHPVAASACEQYQHWVDAGYAAEMDYLRRNIDKRFDPHLLVPGVETIICVAFPFHTPSPARDGVGECPFICSYAQGPDYHEVIKTKLHKLLAFIGGEGRVFVDSAPVMERYWATKAGLGTVSSNGMFSVPGVGNRVFLGEIFSLKALHCPSHPAVTDVPDVITNKGCQAQLGDGTIDARKCLNYLTIEYRGELPEWTRPYLHKCFYGCDRCLDSLDSREVQLPARESERTFWENLTREQYDEIFRHSAVKRIKYEGLMRNILHGKK